MPPKEPVKRTAVRTSRRLLHPFILVDPEDAWLLEEYAWCAVRTKYNTYAGTRSIPGEKFVLLHRKIMGAKAGQVVDHFNTVGLDCRRANLKLTTQRLNILRAHPLAYGVRSTSSGRWSARLGANGHLGTFDTEDEARRAYLKERAHRLDS